MFSYLYLRLRRLIQLLSFGFIFRSKDTTNKSQDQNNASTNTDVQHEDKINHVDIRIENDNNNVFALRQQIATRKYFDNIRWFCISRPQYKASCGISSLTSVWNFLFSRLGHGNLDPLSHEEVMRILGFNEPFGTIKFGPFTGNVTIMRWFTRLCKHFNVKGRASYYWKCHGAGRTIGLSDQEALEGIRTGLQDKNTAFIYHCENHYMTPIGFEICSSDPQEAYAPEVSAASERETFIIIADTSKTNNTLHVVKFGLIAKDLNLQNPNYFNIRHPEQGEMQRKTKKRLGNNLHCFMMFQSNREPCDETEFIGEDKEEEEVEVEGNNNNNNNTATL